MKCHFISSYSGIPTSSKYNCFIFVEKGSSKGDILYVGDESGVLYYFVVSRAALINRQEELNPPEHRDGNHTSSITCLLHSKSRLVASSVVVDRGGLLFSGGSDRVVKVWAAAGNNKPLIQTLYGHTGAISGLCEGHDGSILSCALDSTVRIWAPQGQRQLMLHPYFECTQMISVSPALREIGKDAVWLTGIAVNPQNTWRCFVSTSEGGVIVYEKNERNVPESDGRRPSQLLQLQPATTTTTTNKSAHTVTFSEKTHEHSISGSASLTSAPIPLRHKTISQSSLTRRMSMNMISVTDRPPLVQVQAWHGLHTLGISKLFVEVEANILVTLSFDCTCKIFDASSGAILFTLPNQSQCMYTGLTYCETQSSFYLIDEEGHIEVFNMFYEKSVDYLLLRPVGDLLRTELRNKRKENVLLGHRYPVLTGISLHREGEVGCIFSLFPAGIEADVFNYHSYTNPPDGSVIISWRLTEDVTCSEFHGHEGSIVSLAVVPPPVLDSDSGLDVFALTGRSNRSATEASSHSPITHRSSVHRKSSLTGRDRRASATWANMQVVSREEFRFFSVADADKTIRCWDEVNGAENFQYRMRDKAEPVCLCMLWSLNMLAVGLEDGSLCFMNADSGTQIVNRALKDTISCITEGQHYAAGTGKGIVIAADLSGRVCCYEITDGYKVAATVFTGFHDVDDPSILSLTFHGSSTTVFSGGSDGTIRYWQMNATASTADYRPRALVIGNDEGKPQSRVPTAPSLAPALAPAPGSEPGPGLIPGLSEDTAQDSQLLGLIYIPRDRQVSLLDCTEDFLLAGDESGELRLWAILHNNSHILKARNEEREPYVGLYPPIKDFILIVRWTSPPQSALSTGSHRAHGSLFQADVASVFVAQARGGRCTVWEVDVKGRGEHNTGPSGMEELEALLEDPDAIIRKREENLRESAYYIIDQCKDENDLLEDLCKPDTAQPSSVGKRSTAQDASVTPRDSSSSGQKSRSQIGSGSRQRSRQSQRQSLPKFPILKLNGKAEGQATPRPSELNDISTFANSSVSSVDLNQQSSLQSSSQQDSLLRYERSLLHSRNRRVSMSAGVRQLKLTHYKMRAMVNSVAVCNHPDKEVTCLRLSGSRRSDTPPNLLFVGTAQGTILRFKLFISAERMDENSAAKKRSKAAKTKMRTLLKLAVGMLGVHRDVQMVSEKRLSAPRPVDLVKKTKSSPGKDHHTHTH